MIQTDLQVSTSNFDGTGEWHSGHPIIGFLVGSEEVGAVFLGAFFRGLKVV